MSRFPEAEVTLNGFQLDCIRSWARDRADEIRKSLERAEIEGFADTVHCKELRNWILPEYERLERTCDSSLKELY